MELMLLVIAVSVVVLGLVFTAVVFMNKSVDVDREER
jgi:hypothetical protein